MKWTLIGLLAINLVFATVSDTAAKMWAMNYGSKWLFIALVISLGAFVTFSMVIREGGLAVGSTIALLLTIMTTVFIGSYFFKENVSFGQWIGIGLGLFSILLISEVIKLR
jgi:drug/metabolite transporter (DMT)-like permease